jgi:hypothetical protein
MKMTITVDQLNDFMNNTYTTVAYEELNENYKIIMVNHFGVIKVIHNKNTVLETIQPHMAITTYDNIMLT